jgi:cation diffusion facilitator family transporter
MRRPRRRQAAARNGSRAGTRLVIYLAVAGNLCVALTKFAAAWWTGGSAMLSEAVHSLVDTGNEALLLYGERLAETRPDQQHPLGYGREIYFWSFVVALLVFAVGAGISFYEGVMHILDPRPLQDAAVAYVVLLLSALFEGASWWYAFRNFDRKKGDHEGYWDAIRHSKDPPTFVVLLEDSAALVGIAIALAGTVATHLTGNGIFDGIASIVIGLLLAAVSGVLARESKSLLLGEPASPEDISSLRAIADGDPQVVEVERIWTVHVAPDIVVATFFARFREDVEMRDIEAVLRRIEERSESELGLKVIAFFRPATPVAGVAAAASSGR